MIWTTWRQHRLEGLWALILSALLAACIAYVANQLRVAACSGPGTSVCLSDDLAGQVAQQIVKLNLYTYALVVLPALAGAFIGAPLVAREVENGTHRLVWTQGVTRARWLLVKLLLIALPLMATAAAVGLLEVWLLDTQNSQANHWALFDQQAPTTAASTLFALALGVALGAVIGRSIPAMAATLFVFVVVRIGIAELARPRFQAPLVYTTHDMARFNSPPAGFPDAWWIDQATFDDSAGRVVSNGSVSNGGVTSPGAVAYAVQHYQPADRFWAFQSIESAILVGLALLLLGFAFYWVTRRVS